MKGHLGSIDKNADYAMLPDHFETTLWLDVVDRMIVYCLEHNVRVDTCNADSANSGEIEKKGNVVIITLDKEELMFGGMEQIKIQQKLVGETDHDVIRLKMEMEIDLYLQTPGNEFCGQNMEFTDPIVWWERMEER